MCLRRATIWRSVTIEFMSSFMFIPRMSAVNRDCLCNAFEFFYKTSQLTIYYKSLKLFKLKIVHDCKWSEAVADKCTTRRSYTDDHLVAPDVWSMKDWSLGGRV